MSDSVRPHTRQPTRLPHPWDSQGNNTGVGCHFLLQCMKVKSESEVAQSCSTLSDPMDCSLPGSSVLVGFSRQEYQSGLTFPLLGDLPDPRINLHLLHWQADSSSLHHLESHGHHHLSIISFNKIHVKWEGIRINLLFWNFKMTHAHI